MKLIDSFDFFVRISYHLKRGRYENKKTIVNNRRNNILQFIKDNKQAKTNELVDIFKVSEITIRRDLDYLQSIGKIERFYGGAEYNESNSCKNLTIENNKEKIAKKCADF
ncbi:MAG: DeoR family transcriptional regulator, partial [Anaerococcus sp.]|nr:DeoR family transcriptional regulator [Anaerococcus sp.]